MRRVAIAAIIASLCLPAALAQGQKAPAIPDLASASFGWQTTMEDWEDPPPGNGHGPMKNDPAHPFVNNSVSDAPENGAAQTVDPNYVILNGNQTTVRIANSNDPILMPWAAAAVQATNDEILQGKRKLPFVNHSRCWPGGVPGQLIYPFEPLYFVQTPNEVWMMWQRDHMVRRVYLRDKHSLNPKPSWLANPSAITRTATRLSSTPSACLRTSSAISTISARRTARKNMWWSASPSVPRATV
jgi:hypothetical protein